MLPLLVAATFASGCATPEDSGTAEHLNSTDTVFIDTDTTDVQVLLQRAEDGDPSAQYLLAEAYYFREGVPRDLFEVVRWIRKAAKQGHADAQFSLGVSCDNGQGVVQDYSEAVRWWRKAAEQS